MFCVHASDNWQRRANCPTDLMLSMVGTEGDSLTSVLYEHSADQWGALGRRRYRQPHAKSPDFSPLGEEQRIGLNLSGSLRPGARRGPAVLQVELKAANESFPA